MTTKQNFTFTLFTNNTSIAQQADNAGVERIGVDIERLHKELRQDKKKAWISDHKKVDIIAIREVIQPHKLFARINSIYEKSLAEINYLFDQGVQHIMLPYFKTVKEVEQFLSLVDGRMKTVLLVETKEAIEILNQLITIPEIDEYHFGLNDLSISYGRRSHFHIMTDPLLQEACDLVESIEKPYGIAGLGVIDDESLPISTNLVYAQQARLNSKGALISRSFLQTLEKQGLDFSDEINKARQKLTYFSQNPQHVQEAHDKLQNKVEEIFGK